MLPLRRRSSGHRFTALHCELGAKMVPFAGYEMPVHYPPGILAEHLHTRSQAGLFDVSHMGQLRIAGAGPGHSARGARPRRSAGVGSAADALHAAAERSRAASSTI